MNGLQGLPPAAPLKPDPPGPLAPEVCQQPGKATQFQQGGAQNQSRIREALPLLLPVSLQEWLLMFQTGCPQEAEHIIPHLPKKWGLDQGLLGTSGIPRFLIQSLSQTLQLLNILPRLVLFQVWPDPARNRFRVPRLLPSHMGVGGRICGLSAASHLSFPPRPSVYIPKKAASKARAPRRRQRKTQRPPAPEAPKEIPAEAVKEYSDIMEELVASHLATEESDGKQEEEEGQQQEEGLYPDAAVFSGGLCLQGGLGPRSCFVADPGGWGNVVLPLSLLVDRLPPVTALVTWLLANSQHFSFCSPEQQRDPLALTEELEQEEGLSLAQVNPGGKHQSKKLVAISLSLHQAPLLTTTYRTVFVYSPSKLVQKRLLALEEEDAEAPPSCSGAQLDSSPSVSDEDEEGGGRLRPSPGPWVAGGTICLGKAASPGKQAREVPGGQERALGGPRWLCRDGNPLPSASGWDLQLELAAPQGTRGPLGMERRGSGKVTGQISSHVDDHLGGAGSPGRSLVADRASEALPLCWQEGPQLEIVPHLDVGLSELTPLQGQGLGKQALGMQTGQQIGNLGAAPQEEPLAVPQEGSPGAMWGDDRGPPTVQSYDQDPSLRAAGDRDGAGASLSPGLWLSNVIDTVGLELPLQIEEVIESFHDGECVTEHRRGCQASGTRSSISLGPGETTALEGMGSSAVPCGSTDATLALEKTNYCSLSGPLSANSSASQPKLNRGQSPETIRDPSDLWAGVCPPLLESRIDASTRGASKEAPLPAGQGNILILGPQGTSSFPEASPEAGGRDSSISPLVEATKCGNTLSVRDACGLQLGAAEDTCPLGFHPYDPQGEAREDTDLSEPKDLASLPASRESYAHRTPKSTPPLQGLRSTSPRRGTRDALVVREAPPVSGTGSSADGAKGEEEDEELSNFVYLLASKLSLSPRRGHGSASGLLSGGRRGQRAPPSPTPEARGLSQPPNPLEVQPRLKRSLSWELTLGHLGRNLWPWERFAPHSLVREGVIASSLAGGRNDVAASRELWAPSFPTCQSLKVGPRVDFTNRHSLLSPMLFVVLPKWRVWGGRHAG
ncbi:NUT family member 1 [Camelus dromedarius]|uniref:NUT family member 1 n=1 Tax=Camelus dromedarius TaxID=9838 RepID=A0A5N4E2H2_CAMDR|nr:NUT family member 1 [Camelus dromedarius]